MTLVEQVRELNKLIKDKSLEEVYDGKVYHTTVKDNHIYFEGELVGEEYNTIEKRMNINSLIARQEYYIQESLRTVGIDIPDIETDYDILCQSVKNYLVLLKKTNNMYIFIEYENEQFLECGKELRVIKLDLINNDLIFDRIDFEKFAYFHKESKISDYTLERIKYYWIPKGYDSHNDLYDVMPAELEKCDNNCAYASMDNYGDYVCDLDSSKFNKDICEEEVFRVLGNYYKVEKPKIFYK